MSQLASAFDPIKTTEQAFKGRFQHLTADEKIEKNSGYTNHSCLTTYQHGFLLHSRSTYYSKVNKIGSIKT